MPTFREIIEDPAIFGDPIPEATQAIVDVFVDAATNGSDVGSSGGATELDELDDVTITTPSTGQVLRFNGTVFANATLTHPVQSTKFGQINGALVTGLQGLWHFDGSLAAASGSVSDFTGTPIYATIHGKRGASLQESHQTAANDAALQITGELTVHMLVYPTGMNGHSPSSDAWWMRFGTLGSAEDEASNYLYALKTHANTGNLRYFAERLGGTNIEHWFEVPIPVGGWHLVSFTRNTAGDAVKLYFDGMPAGVDGSGSISAPTGGTHADVRVILGDAAHSTGYCGGLAIANEEASAAGVKAVWNDLAPAGLGI